jgi:hypothetical protein
MARTRSIRVLSWLLLCCWQRLASYGPVAGNDRERQPGRVHEVGDVMRAYTVRLIGEQC